MSVSPASIRSHSAQLGADTRAVLGGLGFSDEALAQLLGSNPQPE